MSAGDDPGAALRKAWARLAPLPGGKVMFSKLLGTMAPYTGTLHATVEELSPGYARVTLRDRRRVRNHLRSIHAIALANLAEISTGLAFNVGLPPGTRSILRGLSIEYVKKARGRLEATCRCETPATHERREIDVTGEIRDASGDVVATACARWLVGPPQDRRPK